MRKKLIAKKSKPDVVSVGEIRYWISGIMADGEADFCKVRVEKVIKSKGDIFKLRLSFWDYDTDDWMMEEYDDDEGETQERLFTQTIKRDEFKYLYKSEEGAEIRRQELIVQDVIDLYNDLEALAEEACSGNITCAIFHGPGGTGKSHTIKKAFKKYGISYANIRKGSSTPTELYNWLYEFKNKGDVLVLDDVGGLKGDSLEFLKAATDTDKERVIHYGRAKSDAVPEPFFVFEGTVIIITNKSLHKYPYAERWQPLLSRAHNILIDLSPEQMLAKIKLITEDDREAEYSKEIRTAVRDFLMDHKDDLGNNLDLRCYKKVADLREKSKNWKRLSFRTVIRNRAGYLAEST